METKWSPSPASSLDYIVQSVQSKAFYSYKYMPGIYCQLLLLDHANKSHRVISISASLTTALRGLCGSLRMLQSFQGEYMKFSAPALLLAGSSTSPLTLKPSCRWCAATVPSRPRSHLALASEKAMAKAADARLLYAHRKRCKNHQESIEISFTYINHYKSILKNIYRSYRSIPVRLCDQVSESRISWRQAVIHAKLEVTRLQA